ncbi:MAG: hypothetical protein HQK99_16755 [Nitrospirae bacterium]|nr:hypothetical protein [Nitrospirota bacterium]
MRNFLNNRPMLINNLSIERIVAIADLRQQQEAVGVKLAAPLKKPTASLIGEGFDLPDISSIFLTIPIKFSGR